MPGLGTINPAHGAPSKLPRYWFRYFHHFIGEGFHGDFRHKQNGYSDGKTIATMIKGSVKEPVSTISEAKKVTAEVDVKFKPDMDPTKHVFAFFKAKQPLAWMEMYNKVVPAGTGPGASKEEEGVFVLVDEGMAYPGAKRPYFEELFLHGKKFKGRFVSRQLETPKEWEEAEALKGALHWEAWMSKDQTPYILSRRARVKKDLVPPDNMSWLPPDWEDKIPKELRWWTRPDLKGKQRLKLIDQAFNYLVDKGILKHRKLELEELGLTEGKFTLRSHYWRGPVVKRGMPVLHHDLLIDTGKKCHDEWNLDRNPLQFPVTGTTAARKECCEKTPDGEENSKWLQWEGSIPPEGVKLVEATVIKRMAGTDRYLVRSAGKEVETQSCPLSEHLLKTGTKIWIDNRKYIYTTRGTAGNPNRVIPAYMQIIDTGRVNWIEDSEMFSSFQFHGKKMKGFWIMRREEPKGNLYVLKKSELPKGGEGKMKDFKWAFPISVELAKRYTAAIEILREGVWEHAEAPDGVLEITKKDLNEFVKNFKDKVVGSELPLDFEHEPEKGHAIGWITNLWTKFKDGSWHLWARLNVTDEKARADLKSGSLKYISPQILINWRNPEDQKDYNVIRSAALTNYPYIKNMEPAVLNFEEVKEEVNDMVLTEEEIKEKEKELNLKKEELETKETELSGKEKGFADQETKLKEGQDALKEEKDALEEEKKELEDVKLQQVQYPKPFYGLPKKEAVALADKCKGGDQKSCDILVKYATGGIYGYPKAQLQEELKAVGIDVELGDLTEFVPTAKSKVEKFEQFEGRIAKLESEKDTVATAFKATVDELSGVTRQLREKEVDTKLEELVRNGLIVPASRDTLRGILMADKSTEAIELEEKDKDGKVVGKKKIGMADAVLKFLEQSPAGVKLGQEGVVTPRTTVDLAEGLKKLMGMTQEEINKLEPAVQEFLLKKIEGFQG